MRAVTMHSVTVSHCTRPRVYSGTPFICSYICRKYLPFLIQEFLFHTCLKVQLWLESSPNSIAHRDPIASHNTSMNWPAGWFGILLWPLIGGRQDNAVVGAAEQKQIYLLSFSPAEGVKCDHILNCE